MLACEGSKSASLPRSARFMTARRRAVAGGGGPGFSATVLGEPSAAQRGEAVFLEAAVGFGGEGALDEAGGKGGLKVGIKKTWAMGQSKGRHQFLGRQCLRFERRKQASDLFGDLTCDLTCDLRGDFTSDWVGDWAEGVHGLQIFRSIAELEGDAGAIQDEFGLG